MNLYTDQTTSAAVVFAGVGPATESVAGGDFTANLPSDLDATVRARLLERLTAAPHRHSWVRQVHGTRILADPDPPTDGMTPSEADGLQTIRRGWALSVVTADCLPILMASARRVVAIHAGWRGLAGGIVERGLSQFSEQDEVTAWIGPAIGACCYQVGSEVADAIARRVGFAHVRLRSPRPHLDLPGAAHFLLNSQGVEDVRRAVVCTRCDAGWASYRRDGPGAGRNIAAIWRL
jgi:YfiH family protein